MKERLARLSREQKPTTLPQPRESQMFANPLWLILLAAAGGAIYWFMVRPVLAQWAAFKPFYATLNTVEATWWFRVRMSVKGLKVRLLNMAVLIATFTLTLAEWVGASGGLISYLPDLHLGASDI